MKKKLEVLISALIVAFGLTNLGFAQHGSTRGKVISPQSNIELPADIGVRAHTECRVINP